MGPSRGLSTSENAKEQVPSNDQIRCDTLLGNGNDSILRGTRSDLDPGGGGMGNSNNSSSSSSSVSVGLRGAGDGHSNGHSDMTDRTARTSLDVPSLDGGGSKGSRHNSTASGQQCGLAMPNPPPPPPDGGWGWMVVVGSIISVGLVPVMFVCFGVFMNAFLNVFPEATKSSASWIPSIMNALMNFMGPITSALVNRFSARLVSFLGGITLSTGLILSYFTTSVQALYLTYGVLGGIGAGLSLPPGLYLLSQYFRRRRGVATGICMAGASVIQICFPFLIQFLLNEYSYNGCILIMGGVTMNICVSAALYRPYNQNAARRMAASKQEGQPKSQKPKRRPSTSLSFLTEDGVVSTKRGSYSAVPESSPKKKKSKTKSKSKKKSQRKRQHRPEVRYATDKNAKSAEAGLLLTAAEKTWQSMSPGEVIVVPRARARTLSMDSTRSLPDIPEEREDDGGPTTATSKVGDELVGDEANDRARPAVSDTVSEPGLKTTAASSSDDAVESNGQLTEGLLSTEDASANTEQPDAATCTPQLVTLNHIFGSVASIMVEDTRPKKRRRLAKFSCGQLHIIMGFENFKLGIFYVLSGSFMLIMVTIICFTMFIPTYGVSLNLSRETSASLLSIISIASAFGRLLLPSLSDYVALQRKHIYAISAVVTSCSIISTIFVRDYTDLVCCLVFFGFASGGCLAISINVFLDYIKLENFTSFFGLVGVVVGTGSLFAAPIMGFMVDKSGNYDATFASLSVTSALSGATLYLDRFTSAKPVTSKKTKPTPV